MFHLFLLFLFILLGIIEAIWGLGQLYGVVLSRHDQFLLTGSFYNPGPYSGFLAMIFPIAFYEWLHRHKEPKSIAGNVDSSMPNQSSFIWRSAMKR